VIGFVGIRTLPCPSEQVARFARNKWPHSVGITGRNQSERVSVFLRINWAESPEYAPFGNYARAVRGSVYGSNDFIDNSDGTVTDLATGLMWQKVDSGAGMDWQSDLTYAEDLELAGHGDWRLPNVRELQSILDYSRSPNAVDAADLGPVIDTDFSEVTPLAAGTTAYDPDYGYFWTSTSAYFNPQSPATEHPIQLG
jgi:uncharacterized protein DUF1566